MNWRRLYASIQIWFVVSLSSAFAAGCWAFLVAGILRIAIGMGENESILMIGLPIFISLFALFTRILPGPLKKAGMLSDKSERFGPWLK